MIRPKSGLKVELLDGGDICYKDIDVETILHHVDGSKVYSDSFEILSIAKDKNKELQWRKIKTEEQKTEEERQAGIEEFYEFFSAECKATEEVISHHFLAERLYDAGCRLRSKEDE